MRLMLGIAMVVAALLLAACSSPIPPLASPSLRRSTHNATSAPGMK